MLKLLAHHVRPQREPAFLHEDNRFWSEKAIGYPRAYFQSGEARDAEHLFVCLVAPMYPCQAPAPTGPGLHEAYRGGVVDNQAIADELASWADHASAIPPGALAWCLVPAESADHACIALTTRSIAPVVILSAAAWRSAEARLRATLDEARDVGASGLVARLLRRKPYGILLQSPSGLRTLWYKAASLADALAAGARAKRADETLAGAVPAQDLADINSAIDNTLAGAWCVQVRIIDGYSQGMEEYKAWLLDLTTDSPSGSPETKVATFMAMKSTFKEETLVYLEKHGIPRKYVMSKEEVACLVRAVGVVQVLASEGVVPVA